MFITIADIHKRLNYLPESTVHTARYTKFERMYEKCLNDKNTNEIMYCIENWSKLPGSTNEVKMAQVIELFDVLSESATTAGPIRKMGDYICNETVTRVRDAGETQYLIRRKLSMTKTKTTSKLNKRIEDAFNAINGASNNTVTAAINSAIGGSSVPYTSKEDQKAQATAEAYVNMYNTASKCIHADRILENYDKISKRFNLDKIITDNAYDQENCVYELCRLIDTYNMPNTVKFNTVLETAYYGLHKCGLDNIDMSTIVESATNYFTMKESGSFDCKAILDAAVVVTPQDKSRVKYITELDPEKKVPETEPEPINLRDIQNESTKSIEAYAEAELHKMPEKQFNHIDLNMTGQASSTNKDSNEKDTFSVPNDDAMDSIMKLDIEIFDKKKHEEVLKATQLTEAYEALVNGEFDKIANSPYNALSYYGINGKVQNLVKSNSIVKDRKSFELLKGTFVEIPNDPNRVKAIVSARLQYCNIMCTCFKGMLETNYKLLGFSEVEAKRLAGELGKGNTEAIKDVKKAFIDRPETYETNFGYDFRKFGGGVVYVAKADLGLFGQYYSPARVVQLAFEHDCIILAHGLTGSEKDKSKFYQTQKFSVDASNKASIIALKAIKAAVACLKQNDPDMSRACSIIKDSNDGLSKYGIQIMPSQFGLFDNKELMNDERIKASIDAMEKYIRQNDNSNYKKAPGLFPQKDANGKIWMIQPIKTESGPIFNTVNDAINYIATKENKKNIIVLSCNPDHVDISKPNIKIPGVKITYAMNTVIADSTDITSDEDIQIIEEELELINLANRYNIDYFDDAYLDECVEFCENSDIEAIMEESILKKAWNSLVGIIAKVIGAIIKFFKMIFNLAGRIFALIKDKINSNKNNKTILKKPIKVSFAEVHDRSAKINQTESTKPADIANIAKAANDSVFNALTKFKNEMNAGNKQLDNFIRKNAKNEAANNGAPGTHHESSLLGMSYNDYDIMNEKFSLKDIKKKISSSVEATPGPTTISNSKGKLEEFDLNKIVDDYKASEDPEKASKLKELIGKLYNRTPNAIVNDLPSILNWIRQIFVLGFFAINPVIGAVVFIGDCVVKYDYRIEDCKKMLDAIDNEIGKAKKAKEKKSISKEDQDRLKQYIDALGKSYSKINEYYEDMLSDKLLDKKYEEDEKRSNKPAGQFDDFDNDDDDFGDIDFDDIEESTNIKNLIRLSSITEGIAAIDEKDMISLINPHIESYPYEMIDCLVEFSTKYPEVLSPYYLAAIMENAISGVRNGKHHNSSRAERYTFINIYKEGIEKLNTKYYSMSNNHDTDIDHAVMSISEAVEYTSNIAEMYRLIYEMNDIYNNYSPVLEISFTNQVKMATEKVKTFFTKMSDKEKSISKNIDVTSNNLAKAAEESLTNDNRTSIIKGTILPSASKVIKMALGSGVLIALHQPVLAVIGILGYLGVSKHYKAKERQMILDEIEVDLQMTEKYIQLAEEKNDMKAMRQLLTIKRDLERQRQRIKYKMTVEFGQKVYDTKSTPDEGTHIHD